LCSWMVIDVEDTVKYWRDVSRESGGTIELRRNSLTSSINAKA
jgi:hypothetical protein